MYSKRLYKQVSNYSQNADFTNSWSPVLGVFVDNPMIRAFF
jgi:hypothetical protein